MLFEAYNLTGGHNATGTCHLWIWVLFLEPWMYWVFWGWKARES